MAAGGLERLMTELVSSSDAEWISVAADLEAIFQDKRKAWRALVQPVHASGRKPCSGPIVLAIKPCAAVILAKMQGVYC